MPAPDLSFFRVLAVLWIIGALVGFGMFIWHCYTMWIIRRMDRRLADITVILFRIEKLLAAKPGLSARLPDADPDAKYQPN